MKTSLERINLSAFARNLCILQNQWLDIQFNSTKINHADIQNKWQSSRRTLEQYKPDIKGKRRH